LLPIATTQKKKNFFNGTGIIIFLKFNSPETLLNISSNTWKVIKQIQKYSKNMLKAKQLLKNQNSSRKISKT